MSKVTSQAPHGASFSSFSNRIIFLSILLVSLFAHPAKAQQYTRGTGVYPGDPKEYFGPGMKTDAVHYRNLALNRAVYQSSSYDYNLTGQLITDGIIDTQLPGWVVVSTSAQGVLERDGREHVLDRHASSQQQIEGTKMWVQVQMAGNYHVPALDSLTLTGSMTADTLAPKPWKITVSGSDDGFAWSEVGKFSGSSLPGSEQTFRFPRPAPGQKMTPQQQAFMRRFASVKRRILNYTFKPGQPVHFK